MEHTKRRGLLRAHDDLGFAMGPTRCHKESGELKLKMIIGTDFSIDRCFVVCLLSAIGMILYHLGDVCLVLK